MTIPKGRKKEKAIYTIEEMQKLFELLETAPLVYRTFITLAVYSGFRRGEMCGLEWNDIDWEHNIISIHRTANYSKLYGNYIDTTKTKRSERSSKLSPVVMNLLRQLKDEQEYHKEMCGSKWQDTNRVFVHDDGAPLHINRPYRWLKDFCRKNNIRFCDIHSLRHFHASVLIFSGVDPVSVSADLGHTAVSTTTSIYCHMFQEAQARTSDIIANALDFNKHKTDDRPAV